MAETIRGINVQIGSDTTGLSKALGDVNKHAKDIQSELKQVERLLKLDPNNTELLAQKQKLLADAVENTQEKLNRLKSVQEQVNDQFARGDISEGQYRAFQREVAKTEQELQKLQSRLKDTGFDFDKLGESVDKAGRKMTDAGKKLSTRVTAPIVALGGVALKAGIDFEAAMSKVQAISGATGEEMDALTEQAKELGATTVFSASEAASGMEFLARAGFSVSEVMAAMPGMLDLAASSAIDLGTAADITSNIMSGFGMEANRAGEVADVLAKATASSNTSVESMGESMKMVAPVSAGLGISLQETAAAIGVLGDAGIQGGMAGTTLRAGLLRLASPTKDVTDAMEELGVEFFDANGQMVSLTEIVRQLESSMEGMTEQQKVSMLEMMFGKNAVSGWMAVIDAGSDKLGNFTDELLSSEGAASDMASVMTDNAKGGVVELMSALEGLAIQLAEILIPVFNEIVKVVKRAVDWFAGLDRSTQTTIVAVAGLVAALGPLLMIFGPLVSGIGKLIPIIGKLIPVLKGSSVAVTALGTAIRFALGPVGLIITAIGGLVAAGAALHKHMSQDSIPTIERFSDAVSEATQESVGAFMDLNDQATVALNDLAWSGRTVTQEMADSIVSTFSDMGDQILGAMEERHAEEIASMQEFFVNAQGLTEEEQAEILANVQQSQEDQRLAVEEGQARINEILQLASDEKRGLSQEEANEINRIQQQMLQTGIEMLSENEVEQKLILERMRENANDLSARQAAEVVQNSIKQKDESVKAAQEQYDDVLRNIIRMRDESGEISAEQADKLIAEAQRQRDESIKRAEEMHQRVVDEAKKQANEHVNSVNWETGEVLNRWQKLGNGIKDVWNNIVNWIKNAWDNIKSWVSRGVNAVGDSVRNGMNRAKQWIEDIWNNVLGFFKNLDLGKVGKDMMQGLVDGIGSMANTVWEKAKGIAQGIGDSIKGFFGIQSPSRLMRGYGENIGEGLAIGIQSSVGDVKRQVAQLNAAASDVHVGGANGAAVAGAPLSSINFDGLFNGAQIIVRNDHDIELLAREIWNMSEQAGRGG